MKYEAILEKSRILKVRSMCKYLGVGTQNYYRWKRNYEKKEMKRWEEIPLIKRIGRIFAESRITYGYRTMSRALGKEGIAISTYRVRKIMRENGFYPVTQSKYNPGRSDRKKYRYSYNELKQQFHADKSGKVLAGDITYIKTRLGWVYLAVVVDLYNREVVGYEVSKSIDTELVKRALALALEKGLRPELFHSDRGSQYSSESFRRMLDDNGIRSSQSKAGYPYDNACVESFFATAKKRVDIHEEICYNG